MLFKKPHQGTSVHSFLGQLKEETSLLTQWLHYFYRKNDEHDIRIRLLEQQTHKTKKGEEEKTQKMTLFERQTAMLNTQLEMVHRRLNIVLEAQEPLLNKLEEVEGKLASSGQLHTPLYESLKELHRRLSLLEKGERKITQAVTPKEHLTKKIAKKAKEYVKRSIQSVIEKYGKIEGLQLREIIVDEQHLCSRSTFYRLLSELEENDSIGSVRQVKEKIYVSQLEKPVLQ